MNHGQIEQVVSSADCRSAERSETELEQSKHVAGGVTGPSVRRSAEPISPDDRIAVALAGRGPLRIGQLLANVFGEPPHGPCLFHLSDEEVVSMLEAYVAR